MDAHPIKNPTRENVGASQGYIGISIRDEAVSFAGCEPVPVMATAWRPTGEERRRILLGEPVILRVLGSAFPPVMLSVGDDNGPTE